MPIRLKKAYKLSARLEIHSRKKNYLLINNGISKLDGILLMNTNYDFYRLYD